MKWWHKALIGTAILIALAAAATVLAIREVPRSRAEDIARLLGGACGVGIVLLWAVCFARHNLAKERLAEQERAQADEDEDLES